MSLLHGLAIEIVLYFLDVQSLFSTTHPFTSLNHIDPGTRNQAAPVEVSAAQQPEKKKQVNLQEIVDSLKSTADDIGQISELSSEEKILVAQFFSSLLKLISPLTSSIAVSQLALPAQVGDVTQAYIDPTGHLVLHYADGHVELKNLSE